MNREEILSRVSKEKGMDEREEKVLLNALSISGIITQIICIIFMIIRIILANAEGYNEEISDLVILIFMQSLFSKLYEFKMMKKKKDLILLIIYVIITVLSIMYYINNVLY